MKEKELTSELLNANVVPFIRPPETKLDFDDKDDDWLWPLSEGSVFLVAQPIEKDQYNRPHRNPVLLEFHVIAKLDDPNKTKRCVRLLSNINQEHFQWVISGDFSQRFTLHKVVIKGEDLP